MRMFKNSKQPNADTIAAMQEIEKTGGERTKTPEDMFSILALNQKPKTA